MGNRGACWWNRHRKKHTDTPPRVLALDGKAVATSGDRWHQYQADGQAYSQPGPRGMPVRQVAAAVTVVADDAMHADAWATALTVLGHEQGMALAEREGLAARYLQRAADGPRSSACSTSRTHERTSIARGLATHWSCSCWR